MRRATRAALRDSAGASVTVVRGTTNEAATRRWAADPARRLRLDALGPMNAGERAMFAVFAVTVTLWTTAPLLHDLNIGGHRHSRASPTAASPLRGDRAVPGPGEEIFALTNAVFVPVLQALR